MEKLSEKDKKNLRNKTNLTNYAISLSINKRL